VVEVRFLYAFKESNALYQPVYLRPRVRFSKEPRRNMPPDKL
jgi:hypothetical protein